MNGLPEGFGPESRIALYYAPPAASAWWRAGCEWLGRDPESGAVFDHAGLSSADRLEFQRVIEAPRRYGWHATLVAPFRRADGVDPQQVLDIARNWADGIAQRDIPVNAALMGRFVALRATHESDDALLRDVAASALREVSACRARAAAADIERRIAPGMSERQVALLREWDYPYVLDEFRFHMTVSGSLQDRAAQEAVASEWNHRIATLGRLPFHGAALFVETQPGADFMLWQRLPFTLGQEHA